MESIDYAFSIVEMKKLLKELEDLCLAVEVKKNVSEYVAITRKLQDINIHSDRLAVWAKKNYIELITK